MKWIYWTIIIGFVVAIFGAPFVLAEDVPVVCVMPVLGFDGGGPDLVKIFPCSPVPQPKDQDRIINVDHPADQDKPAH